MKTDSHYNLFYAGASAMNINHPIVYHADGKIKYASDIYYNIMCGMNIHAGNKMTIQPNISFYDERLYDARFSTFLEYEKKYTIGLTYSATMDAFGLRLGYKHKRLKFIYQNDQLPYNHGKIFSSHNMMLFWLVK